MPLPPFKTSAYAHLATVGKALSSPTRLQLLELLLQAPRTVEALASEVGQSVANTSHHLHALKAAHLAKSVRQGQHVEYAVVGPEVAALVAQLHLVASRHVAELQALTRDYFGQKDGLEAVDIDTLAERLRMDEVVLVDVRPEHEFNAGHLPRALSLPLDTLESRLADLPRDRTIVAYCRGPFCAFSAEAVRRLRTQGFQALRTNATVADAAALQGVS